MGCVRLRQDLAHVLRCSMRQIYSVNDQLQAQFAAAQHLYALADSPSSSSADAVRLAQLRANPRLRTNSGETCCAAASGTRASCCNR